MKETLVFIDFETTGLDPQDEKIIQIAAIKIQDNKEEVLTTYVNPEKNIAPFIENLTGINDKMVIDAPKEKEALEMLMNFIPTNSIVIAQNAPFDLSFIHYGFLRAGYEPVSPNFYCTRTMAAVLFPNLSHKLVDIINLFDIKLDNAHNALSDAIATKELFFKLKHIADLHNINFINKLVEHPDRPLKFDPINSIKIVSRKK